MVFHLRTSVHRVPLLTHQGQEHMQNKDQELMNNLMNNLRQPRLLLRTSPAKLGSLLQLRSRRPFAGVARTPPIEGAPRSAPGVLSSHAAQGALEVLQEVPLGCLGVLGMFGEALLTALPGTPGQVAHSRSSPSYFPPERPRHAYKIMACGLQD